MLAIPDLERWRQKDFWNLLDIQPRRIEELQVQRDFVSKTKMGSHVESWLLHSHGAVCTHHTDTQMFL